MRICKRWIVAGVLGLVTFAFVGQSRLIWHALAYEECLGKRGVFMYYEKRLDWLPGAPYRVFDQSCVGCDLNDHFGCFRYSKDYTASRHASCLEYFAHYTGATWERIESSDLAWECTCMDEQHSAGG